MHLHVEEHRDLIKVLMPLYTQVHRDLNVSSMQTGMQKGFWAPLWRESGSHYGFRVVLPYNNPSGPH
eukprot:5017155-Pyramimonas_sp.AAC.1